MSSVVQKFTYQIGAKMINRHAQGFCSEDISLIENYQEALADPNETWDCHHRLEIVLDGTGIHVTSKRELIERGLYYNRPASELVFMREKDHHKMHSINFAGVRNPMSGKNHSQESREKISRTRLERIAQGLIKPRRGFRQSEETCDKISQKAKERLSDRTKHPLFRKDIWDDEAKIVEEMKRGVTLKELAERYKSSVKPFSDMKRKHLDEIQKAKTSAA